MHGRDIIANRGLSIHQTRKFLPRVLTMGKRGPSGIEPGLLEVWQHQWFMKFWVLRDGRAEYDRRFLTEDGWEPDRVKRIPGEPSVWEAIKAAKTRRAVIAAFESSKHWINPKSPGSMYIEDLPKAAAELIAAKKDKRYPRSVRPSSDDKRMAFLATAMAAVAWKTRYRTALNLIGTEKLLKQAKQIRAAEKDRLSKGGMFVLENKRGDFYGDGLTYWRPQKTPLNKTTE